VLIRFGLRELLIIFLLIFTFNNYIGNSDSTLGSDGIGYYDYLPALFIHDDLNRHKLNKDDPVYDRFQERSIFAEHKDRVVNKCFCGTSLLISPFFFKTLWTIDDQNKELTGYETEFHTTVFHAALFYLFLGLIFIRMLLKEYGLQSVAIVSVQILAVFATSIPQYVNADAGFSHVYSFFAISAFLYFSKRYFKSPTTKSFLFACVFFGLIFILRPINIMIVCFLPFIAGDWNTFKTGIVEIIKPYSRIIVGIPILLAFIGMQCYLWFLQTGDFIVYSYPGEGFNFSNPHFYDVLFSYRKGLFVYAPILLFSFLSFFYLLSKREYYIGLTWLGGFVSITYIISSWHSWYYGYSYGSRAFIDYYPLFFIMVAIFLDRIVLSLKIIVLLLALPLVYLNIVQAYQYKASILHAMDMDMDKYWKVFLKTEDRYKWLVWKQETKLENYRILDEFNLGSGKIEPNTDLELLNFSKNYEESISLVRITIRDDFYEKSDSKILLEIVDSNTRKRIVYSARYLIQFAEGDYGVTQNGYYDYIVEIPNDAKSERFRLVLEGDKNQKAYSDVKMEIYTDL
jgi:hypothetical protein